MPTLFHRVMRIAEQHPRHLYKPLLRPASFATLPGGLQWEYVERPAYITLRTDLPLSKHPHGVIATDRALTADELQAFDLEVL